jgi:hypothetical protein
MTHSELIRSKLRLSQPMQQESRFGLFFMLVALVVHSWVLIREVQFPIGDINWLFLIWFALLTLGTVAVILDAPKERISKSELITRLYDRFHDQMTEEEKQVADIYRRK